MKNGIVQLAIVGLGGMGNWHREWISGQGVWYMDDSTGTGIPGIEVKGSFDIREERQEFAREKGIIAYDSLDALLADAEIDVILIATPNDAHKEIAVKAMRAGKNVISEKPVAMDTTELQEMIDVSNETGKLFTVHQNRRWDKDYLTMKHIFDTKEIGEVFCIESRVHGSRGIPGDWRGVKANGGGMVLDWGVHIIDQLLMMVPQKIKSLYCRLTNVTNYEVDDGFKLMITFESGLTALLEVGTNNFVELPRWYMLGDLGTATIEGWDMKGKIVKVTNWDEKDVTPIRAANGLTKTMAPRTEDTIKTQELPNVPADLSEYYKNIVACVKGEATQLVTHAQVMRVLSFIEACFKSHELESSVNFE